MIRYSLKCSNGHGFESWFRSAGAFDGLVDAGHLSCPDCGVGTVEKALMAPRVGGGAEAEAAPASERPLSVPRDPRETVLAKMREAVEAHSEYVGLRFAAEARKIHAGDAPGRMIHGEARPEEARALVEEGVPVAPLPFLPRNRAN